MLADDARRLIAEVGIEDEDVVEHLVGVLTRMPPRTAWVLLRQAEPRDTDHEPPEVSVLGAYLSEMAMLGRLKRIERANRKYPLRQIGEHGWLIGPEEDEGFFGDRRFRLWAVQVPLGV